jgi:ABC-2 type transport system permease protein
MMREVRGIFYTPVAYVVMVALLVMLGFIFQVGVSDLNKSTTEDTVLQRTFLNGIFFFTLPIMTSLITMRTFAEEYRMGTIEALTTAPVTEWHVVLAKFFGTVAFFMIALIPSLLFFIVFDRETGGHPVAKGVGAIYSTYFMILLISMLFISAGNFASSLVKDQVTAGVISIIAKLLFLVVPLLLAVMLNVTDPRVRLLAEFLSPFSHLKDAASGIIDSRRVVWYLSLSAFFVILTHHIFHSRKLKS